MPPLLTSRQMFVTGLALTTIGIALSFLGDFWFAQVVDPASITYGQAGTVATIAREVTLTLGLVLVGASLVTRHIELQGGAGRDGS